MSYAMMKGVHILFFIFFFVFSSHHVNGQVQKIGYIDTDYILENLSEYQVSLKQLEKQLEEWNKEISLKEEEVEKLQFNLNADKAFLTNDLLEERETEISEKKTIISQLKQDIFGKEGKFIQLKKKLIQPIQDQVWNAVSEIASSKRYSFIFDKASILMVYTDKRYDVSEQVLNILKDQ